MLIRIRCMSKPIKDFTDLDVWQKSHHLYLGIAEDVKLIPPGKGSRDLIDQVLRSSSSISTNIAEGFSSGSAPEYCRYLTIALKTTGETRSWILKLGDSGMIQTGKSRGDTCVEISKMLWKLRKSVARSPKTPGA